MSDPTQTTKLREFTSLYQFISDHYTQTLAMRVAERCRLVIEEMMDTGLVHRQALSMHFAWAYPDLGWPWLRTIHMAIFGQQPRGEWEYDFDDIALGKNRIAARTGQLSRVIQMSQRHNLMRGDVEFWGNWMCWPILVAASGVKPWFDTAFATMAGSMVFAELEQILHDVYGMTAEEAGLVTYDGATLPIFGDHRVVDAGQWAGSATALYGRSVPEPGAEEKNRIKTRRPDLEVGREDLGQF